ncbi:MULTISPECIES: low molecular weight protein-tyrosine-phosphatase [unclassified Caballeronia]|uniref:low molecular weight protein-tyrosine-phosphatase n=1 Tax=unclassified Caballeronia TaxID=2646786 RepID=UPI002863FE4D|nr:MULTISPECIES: low molecular weight protein-tyrosine-phosphatase [unclassified Caballeronia]MDR5754856.1 low molecular weight phosphotyrosine protein phosphatase [Caballeronia sp. LZ024]MDR5839643.1 low molecular weight phosphotyrosine protein phosphatase [Caballeronia sp. LZ031]
MIKSILVVCEGNICRSPMAMALFAHRFAGAHVVSAGTGALVGAGADPIAIELMAERGIDIRSHVANAIDARMVRDADLVLTATSSQRRDIESAFPFARGRVYRLCEQANRDVTDPYRKGRATFETSLKEIEDGVQRWLDIINRTNHK